MLMCKLTGKRNDIFAATIQMHSKKLQKIGR